jgi:hypothetical protein
MLAGLGRLRKSIWRRACGFGEVHSTPGFVTMESCPTNNTPAQDQPPRTAQSRPSLSAHERLRRLAGSAACPRILENSLDSPSAR